MITDAIILYTSNFIDTNNTSESVKNTRCIKNLSQQSLQTIIFKEENPPHRL